MRLGNARHLVRPPGESDSPRGAYFFLTRTLSGELVGQMPPSQTPYVALLDRAARGDETALAQLYDETSARVFGLTLGILRERGAAEEATLETYSSVWWHAASYDPEKSNPMTWILTIARSKAIDILRSRTRRGEKHRALEAWASLDEPPPNPEAETAQAERCAQVRTALASLPRDQRVAIETAFFAGLSHSEVAAALGEPLGTVKSRIRLGLSSLRRSLLEIA